MHNNYPLFRETEGTDASQRSRLNSNYPLLISNSNSKFIFELENDYMISGIAIQKGSNNFSYFKKILSIDYLKKNENENNWHNIFEMNNVS